MLKRVCALFLAIFVIATMTSIVVQAKGNDGGGQKRNDSPTSFMRADDKKGGGGAAFSPVPKPAPEVKAPKNESKPSAPQPSRDDSKSHHSQPPKNNPKPPSQPPKGGPKCPPPQPPKDDPKCPPPQPPKDDPKCPPPQPPKDDPKCPPNPPKYYTLTVKHVYGKDVDTIGPDDKEFNEVVDVGPNEKGNYKWVKTTIEPQAAKNALTIYPDGRVYGKMPKCSVTITFIYEYKGGNDGGDGGGRSDDGPTSLGWDGTVIHLSDLGELPKTGGNSRQMGELGAMLLLTGVSLKALGLRRKNGDKTDA